MQRSVSPLIPQLVAPVARPALHFGERSVDYTTLARVCARFEQRLAVLGLARGDRVAVWAHPEFETMLGFVAALFSDLLVIPLNPEIGAKELAHILADAVPKTIFSAYPERDTKRNHGIPVHGLVLNELLQDTGEGSARDATLLETREDDARLLVYTSGTTGAPKGALLSLRNIASTLDGLEAAWHLSESDALIHALPLFHVHGLVFGLLGALRVGASLRWLPRFEPKQLSALLDSRSVLYAVPTMYRRLAEAAEHDASVREGLGRARLLVSGSAALPAREHARIERLTGQKVCERYGLSETLINTAVRSDGERRPGYVGCALPGVEVRIVDEQRAAIDMRDDRTLGEVCVRGPNVFLGYLNNQAATDQARDADGWFYTGDLGTLSPDGYLRIVGRKATDLIKTGGFKVGAGEVEGALLEHPSVREAAVIGAPDEDLGERIVAYVVLNEGAPAPNCAELIDHVRTNLAPHKRPRDVHFVDDLPRNAMGKVQKAKLRTRS